MPSRTFIRHVVFFSAKEKADIGRIMEGLRMLGNIPHSSVFEVVQNKRADPWSSEIDIIVYAEFADDAALKAYKAHPIYDESIAAVRALRDIRIVADF